MSEINQGDPDVNTFDVEDPENDEHSNGGENGDEPGEQVPVPTGQERPASIEEPPGLNGPPASDVDDSPKQIA